MSNTMKLAKARLKIDNMNSDVPIHDVTPAEVMVLAMDHMPNVGNYPIDDLEVTGEVERTKIDEIKRLRGRYGKDRIKSLFPGAIPQLPDTFDMAQQAVIEAASDNELNTGPGTFFGSAAEADALRSKAIIAEKAQAKKAA